MPLRAFGSSNNALVRGFAAIAMVFALSVATVGVSAGRAASELGSPRCPAVSTRPHRLPAWTADANPPRGVPYALSQQRNVAAVLFGYPLTAPARANKNNKILWIVHEPRHG